MQKTLKKSISILLSILMVVSLFAVVPITASATETFETLDLTQHYDDDNAPKSFNGERFSVQVYGDEADITAYEDGWLFDGDYPGAYASISAMNGETITKIVVHRSNYENTLIVKADDNTIPYSQNGDDFTYDNINASSVKLSADPDYPDDCYCGVPSIDVYYTGGSDPSPAPALTRDDVDSLLSSMEAMIDGYMAHNDMEHAESLIGYYNSLSEALYQANGEVTPEVESKYNAAYTYFTENGGTVSGGQGGSGGSYPNVNNVYRATDEPVYVTVSDLQPGDVLVASSAPMEVQKGDCNIVLIGGTYGDGDVEQGILFETYTDDVTLGNELRFDFMENNARITDEDNHGHYVPVYNNALGNAYMVLGNNNGTVYLAGYNFTTYTITWKDYNGSDLYDGQSTVAPGTVPYYRWSVSRNSTAQYSYTFTGWTDSSNTFYSKDSDLPAATKDETYTATYSQTLRSYTITWKDGDNKTLKSESVAYGTTPSYTGATPTKTEDDGYTYEFNNTWSPSVASVTGNATYTAQFTAVPKPAPTGYTVTWKNWDGTVLETDENVAEAATPEYSGEAPTKAADAQNTYTFAAWDDGTTTYVLGVDDLPPVTADVTYTAVFTAETNTYKVTWKNWDGNVLKADENVPYGTVPEYKGARPEKPGFEDTAYTFTGWTPEVTSVTGDVEYTAEFGVHELIGDYYYVNGQRVGSYYGLIQVDGDYYYVDSYAKIVKNKTKFLNTTNGLTFADGTPIPRASYNFDADGKMIIPNGLVDDYYYINGVRVGSYYGLIQVDGDYYYVDNYAKIVKNKTKFLNTTNGLTFADGTPIPRATYSFDADGKMIIPNGIDGDSYYINGVKVGSYYGLVKDGNDYYYVDANAKIVRSKNKYLTTTNDLTFPDGTPIPHKYFEFDADGKMIF